MAGSVVKNPPADAGDAADAGSIPELGRSPGEGNENPLQSSCLENPMDRGAWWATIHEFAKESVVTNGLNNFSLLASDKNLKPSRWSLLLAAVLASHLPLRDALPLSTQDLSLPQDHLPCALPEQQQPCFVQKAVEDDGKLPAHSSSRSLGVQILKASSITHLAHVSPNLSVFLL